ncbi:MAG: hypothetical protein U9P63_00345 [Patescibacteria group bacterium]|nr:hypothetical protein [Patescibacteria group bacterium]
MEISKRNKIMANALRYYLGKPLRVDRASDVLHLVEKIERADYKININEKKILQNALGNYLKWFFQRDSAPNVMEVMEYIEKYTPTPTSSPQPPISTSLFSSRLGDKWTHCVI